MRTTLNKIREHGPCSDGWEKLLRHLGKTKADDEPLPVLTILDSNGLEDAIWCLRAVTGYDRDIRLYAVWCARQVQHLMKDQRSVDAVDVAERFAKGLATVEELTAAKDAAMAAVRYAESEWAAARYAKSAWAAVMYAESAWAAVRYAESVWISVRYSTVAAERAEQESELRRILKELT